MRSLKKSHDMLNQKILQPHSWTSKVNVAIKECKSAVIFEVNRANGKVYLLSQTWSPICGSIMKWCLTLAAGMYIFVTFRWTSSMSLLISKSDDATDEMCSKFWPRTLQNVGKLEIVLEVPKMFLLPYSDHTSFNKWKYFAPPPIRTFCTPPL